MFFKLFPSDRTIAVVFVALVVSIVLATTRATQPEPVPPPPPVPPENLTFTTLRAFRPQDPSEGPGHMVFFMDREKMRGRDAKVIHFKAPKQLDRSVTLPIDWGKEFAFPMDLNDTYGDCYYAAGCHGDNTYTANAGTESVFSLTSIRTRYFALSGGDNGLGDSDMQGEMSNRYLADVPAAKIVSWANIDTTDAAAMQLALSRYGVVYFTFAVAPAWIRNSSKGALWDANTYTANRNGHAVIFNGCDTSGKYKLQTWGVYVWMTPAAVRVCQPGGWVAFSARWFDAKGFAPNGTHIVDLAKQWQADTGKSIPAAVISSFPPPGILPPLPPTPPPGGKNYVTYTINGVSSTFELGPIVLPAAAK